jgi:hypothetical protein
VFFNVFPKKSKQVVSVTPVDSSKKLEIIGIKTSEVEKEPSLPPYNNEPDCPKCGSYAVSDAYYCKGKKFLRNRCEHNLKGEHLHRSCRCGFKWAHAVRPEIEKALSDKFGEKFAPKDTVYKEWPSKPAKLTNKNPLSNLGVDAELLNEVVGLSKKASAKEVQEEVPFHQTKNIAKTDIKGVNCFREMPIQKHVHLSEASPCARQAMIRELADLARNLKDRDFDNATNRIATLTGYINIL